VGRRNEIPIYFKAMNRPIFSPTSLDEKNSKVEAISDKTCKFTRTVALNLAFDEVCIGVHCLSAYEEDVHAKVPDSLVKVVAEGTLPRKSKEQ
jgi:hypothetical protein